eukprot:754010-Hanusia_phi.AAC.2
MVWSLHHDGTRCFCDDDSTSSSLIILLAFQSLARRVYREWKCGSILVDCLSDEISSGAHVAEVNGDAEQELVRRFNIAGYTREEPAGCD